jgi:hypothetical protein
LQISGGGKLIRNSSGTILQVAAGAGLGGSGGGSGVAKMTVCALNADGNTATCSGGVKVTLTAGGGGYTAGTYALGFTGGAGGGAAGTYTVNAGGVVAYITLASGGNYTVAPAGVTFTGGGGSGAAATAALPIVALPFDLQKNTYNGRTVVFPNGGSHAYTFLSAGLRSDTVLLPDGTSPALNATIIPPYLGGALPGDVSSTPTGWNAINVATPAGGTGVAGVTLQDLNASARRWEVSLPSCYLGNTSYQLVPAAPCGSDV